MAGGLQFLAEGGKRITVAGGGGVGWDLEGLADLLEREFVPDLEDEHLALDGGQALQRGFNLVAAVGVLAGLGFESAVALLEAAVGLFLAGCPAGVAAGVVKRGPADGRDKQGLRVAREVPLVAPVTDEGFLDHILGIGERAGPLAGAQQQLGAVGFEPVFPGSVIICRLHAIRRGLFPEERHGTGVLSNLRRNGAGCRH